jgi:hypothetical protein
MSLPRNFDYEAALRALPCSSCDNEDKSLALQTAFLWKDTPQGYAYWRSEITSLEASGSMTAAAQEQIKLWVAEAIGFTPVGAAAKSVVDKLNPASDGAVATPSGFGTGKERDAFPARAIQFGSPQQMTGLGHWDNARYFPDAVEE